MGPDSRVPTTCNTVPVFQLTMLLRTHLNKKTIENLGPSIYKFRGIDTSPLSKWLSPKWDWLVHAMIPEWMAYFFAFFALCFFDWAAGQMFSLLLERCSLCSIFCCSPPTERWDWEPPFRVGCGCFVPSTLSGAMRLTAWTANKHEEQNQVPPWGNSWITVGVFLNSSLFKSTNSCCIRLRRFCDLGTIFFF